jgi:hypothetical protein
MNSTNTTARIIGVLYLLSTSSFLIGAILLEPAINNSDYLVNLYPTNKIRLSAGVLLQLVNDAAIVGIGVLLFGVLKRHNENIALWVLSTRIIESVILVVGGMSLLLLLTISQEYIKAGSADASYPALGALAKKWNYWSFEIAMLALGLGGFFLCYLLYTSKLVPRLISLLGFIGYPILFAKMSLDVLGYTTGMNLFLASGILVGLFELIFPIWLLAKGFNTNAKPADSELAT